MADSNRATSPVWRKVLFFGLPTAGCFLGMIASDALRSLEQPGAGVLYWVIRGLTLMVAGCIGESIRGKRLWRACLAACGLLLMAVGIALPLQYGWSELRSSGAYTIGAAALVLLGAGCGVGRSSHPAKD